MLKTFFNFITCDKFYLPVIATMVGVIGYNIISRMIIKVSKINNKLVKGGDRGYNKRKSTVIGLINNIIKYIIDIIIIIVILNVYGVNTKNIVASIGILGAVIGLAFQDIIKDFLSGIFIIFDNAYAVGDWVTIDNFKGEVISMGLKTTKIRAYTGEIMVLSNSSFNKIINYNLNPPKIYLLIPFSYDEKIEKIETVLTKVLEDLKKDKNVKKYQLLGVDSFEESCINYALEVDCLVGSQHMIRRKLLKNIKLAFDEEKIVIPYNQVDIHIEK
jgi:small conductance mechanosensitive channel